MESLLISFTTYHHPCHRRPCHHPYRLPCRRGAAVGVAAAAVVAAAVVAAAVLVAAAEVAAVQTRSNPPDYWSSHLYCGIDCTPYPMELQWHCKDDYLDRNDIPMCGK